MMDCGMTSIRGKIRENDEDSVFYSSLHGISEGVDNSITLGIVADGMGGGENGEIASRYAVHVLLKNVNDMVIKSNFSPDIIKQVLLKSIAEANELVSKYIKDHGVKTMGTTVTAALIKSDTVYVVNIGDSRTYLISKDGNVKKKTKDHSYVQELVDGGYLDESKVRSHPQRNIVTRVVDGTDDANPDFYQWQIFKGDSVVLCCDGMWEPLDDRVIAKTVSTEGNLQEKVRLLVDAANELDGSDNISVIVLKQLDGLEEKNYISEVTKRKRPERIEVP